MTIKVISDSANDVPKEYARRYDIEVLPLHVNDGEKEYADGVDIDVDQIYEGMKEGVVYRTSQVVVEDFYQCFKRNADEGNTVIYPAFSSGLSGTYGSAVTALARLEEERGKCDLHLVDTKAASFGAGMSVVRAAMMAEQGKTVEEILVALEFYNKNADHLISVDDMVYLYRGGRISKTKMLLGGLLNIRPIIEVVRSDGTLSAIDKVRSEKKLAKRYFEMMNSRSADGVFPKEQTVSIFYGDHRKTAEQLKEAMIEELGVKSVLLGRVGSTIGSHTGPGILVVFFLNDLYGENDILEIL
jgi:DegV family protein with EDD domain